MTTAQETETPDTTSQTVCYVYGIVPADVEADPEAYGIGGPPNQISVVCHGDVAALISEISADRPLGDPQDLAAHAHVLDGAAGEVPVLPMRFGAVVSDRDAVAEELLAAHHDEFADALRQLDGQAQYVIKGRYDENAILDEVLSESQEAVALRDAIKEKPADATRNERMAIGELIVNALAAKREVDTRQVLELLDQMGVTTNPREATHERDAVHIACLAEVATQGQLERLVGSLARAWEGRVEMRLIGPVAPYDFVVTGQGQG